MSHYHPSGPESLRLRDSLLQTCLRPDPLPFGIAEEYPIVLSEGGAAFSYCMDHEDQLCSHVNLWPRRVLDSQGRERFRIGLVGNVATDPGRQGQGFMKSLLAELAKIASAKDLDALLLWSDLTQFYHKLGYASVGKEFHFQFRTKAKKIPPHILSNPPLTEGDLRHLLGLRMSVGLTLERSPEEFARLLTIPWLDLLLLKRKDEICAYALIGKGYDMMGVIHEWGARNPEDVLELVQAAGLHLDIEGSMLLAPGTLPKTWKQSFDRAATGCEAVPMALLKNLKHAPSDFAELFVWGLDSI